jgi:outer membrane protein assembly factor BamB
VRGGKEDQIITSALPYVVAYDARKGTELWRAECMDGEVAPSPVFAGGYVLVCNSGAVIAALRPDGLGDVTKTHIAWTAEDGLPDITSPLSNGELVVLLTTDGLLTCYAVADGKLLWEVELEEMFMASPSLAGASLYLTTEKGLTIIGEISREGFKETGRCELGEKVNASIAFADGRLYMRGKKHLWCLGAAPAKPGTESGKP